MKHFTVTATDPSGNTTTGTQTVTVRFAPAGLAGGKSAATLPFFPSAPAGFSTVNGFPDAE